MGALEGDSRIAGSRLVRRLGEAGHDRDDDLVGELDLLAHVRLPIPEGIVLTREFHRQFMEESSLLQFIQASTSSFADARRRAVEARSRYRSVSIGGELNRLICEALIELGAPVVVVLSGDTRESGLKSIPEVRAAIRDAWLSLEGLERQIEAVAPGEDLPTWPVLVQREL